MPLLSVAVAILVLLALVLLLKLDAFFAILGACFVVGLMNGMDALGVLQSLLKGIGSTMGSVALILVFGAMLGRLAARRGARHRGVARLEVRPARRAVRHGGNRAPGGTADALQRGLHRPHPAHLRA